jgi:RNA polymerase sigma factor (sigma-70 family)
MEPLSLSAARLGRTPLLRLQSDERLAALAAAGHQAAFEVLVGRYRSQLIRACQRVLPDGRAEDAVQQALLSAYQALGRHGPPDRFRPWLYRIALNAAMKMAADHGEAEELPQALAGGEQPEEARELRERVRTTVRAIGALPTGQRRALVARELEGRSHEEIARELGLSGGAVRQLIHRARSSVRAAASALIPPELLLRLLERAGPEASGRLAEVVGPGAGAALGTKVAVAAVLAGGVAGGAALAPVSEDVRPQRAIAEDRVLPASSSAEGATSSTLGIVTDDNSGQGSSGESSGPGGGDRTSSGPSASSGPGPSASDSSGSGSSDSDGADSSGSGSSGSSGSNSSGDSGSDTSDTSGSGTSSSGSSGSG